MLREKYLEKVKFETRDCIFVQRQEILTKTTANLQTNTNTQKRFIKEECLPMSWIQGYCSWLVKVLPKENFSRCSIEISNFYPISFRICPIQFFPNPVTCQSIWGNQAWNNDILYHISTLVKIRLFDGFFAHIGPINDTLRIQEVNCGSILQTTDNDSRLHSSSIHQSDISTVGKKQQRRSYGREEYNVINIFLFVNIFLIK